MNVSLIVGTVRTLAPNFTARGDARSLNRCLVGRMQGGFATGLVLRLDPDGT